MTKQPSLREIFLRKKSPTDPPAQFAPYEKEPAKRVDDADQYLESLKSRLLCGTLQLKGEDEVYGHHTQRFTKKNWDGSLRLRLPSAIAYMKQTIKREILEHQEYLRNLTAPLDEIALETYVAEVRELNQQEERDRLMEEEREKRKALEERREKVRKAREDARRARGEAVEEEDPVP